MRKLRIYLDTSVISHLDQPEKPSEQASSAILFEAIHSGAFEVFLSDVVLQEINQCSPTKRETLLTFISQIDYINLAITPAVSSLAELIITRQVLPPSSIADSQQIAAAILAGCDYIVSWNMKHIANVEVNKGIRHITIDEGYKEIMLVPPPMLPERSEVNDGE